MESFVHSLAVGLRSIRRPSTTKEHLLLLLCTRYVRKSLIIRNQKATLYYVWPTPIGRHIVWQDPYNSTIVKAIEKYIFPKNTWKTAFSINYFLLL